MLNHDLEEITNSIACQFSFQTVFYRTPYSYCCCPCAYQHEYFDYLSDKGPVEKQTAQRQKERDIDEDVFEQIVQNIANRRCPHTTDMESKYLANSAVFKDQILAVTGSRESLKRLTQTSWNKSGSIFQLDPFVNLVLKNSCLIYHLIEKLDHLTFFEREIMYPIRSKDNQIIVNWESLSLLEYCARKINRNTFQRLLMSLRLRTWTYTSCKDLTIHYDLALKYELKELLDRLIADDFNQEGLYTKSSQYGSGPDNCD